jgi:hypothetical protein
MTCPGARQSVYETNSAGRVTPQTGVVRRSPMRLRPHSQADLCDVSAGVPAVSNEAYSFGWLVTLAKNQASACFVRGVLDDADGLK